MSTHHGILIRPSKIEQSTATTSHTVTQSASKSTVTSSISNPNMGGVSASTGPVMTNSMTISTSMNTNSTSSSSVSPYIINLKTNQMLEMTFPDEMSKTQWLTLVHTHITPFIDDHSSSSKDDAVTATPLQTSQQFSDSAINLHYQNSCSSTTSNSSLMSGSSLGSSISAVSIKNKSNLKLMHQASVPLPQSMLATPMNNNNHHHHHHVMVVPHSHSAVSTHLPTAAMPVPVPASAPSVTAQRCHSNCSSIVSNSSVNSSAPNTAVKSNNANVHDMTNDSLNGIEPLNLTGSLVNSPPVAVLGIVAAQTSNGSVSEADMVADMQLSPDLANIIYSFNYLIEQSLCHGKLDFFLSILY